jgi:peptide chain release factor subunit 3
MAELAKQKNIEKPKPEKAKKVKDVQVIIDENVKDVDETRDPASLIFIGHVDAGKSTICGQLMYLMGSVDTRTIEKYKQEAKDLGRDSWWLAYVMDNSKEEKEKGKTVEVGRATFKTESKKYSVFDAPGHKNYVPNMIMGAACADFGGLVISARKGEFEAGFEQDGQTREHAQLAQSLGVKKLIIVVNKMDDQSCKWNVDRWNEIKEGLTPFLHKTGYKDEDLYWVPISGLTGDNMKDRLPKNHACKWYDGPSLCELLDTLPLDNGDPNGPIRIPVLDKMRDRGVMLFGKVESGTVHMGSKITLMPNNIPCQVGNVYDGDSEAVKYAKPGENVMLRLLQLEDEDLVNKGDVICDRDNVVPVSMMFEAEINVMELLDYKPILTKGYQCIMHLHTFADEAVIGNITASYETNDRGETSEKKNPKFAKSHSRIICRVSVRIPVGLEKYDVHAQLGRFTLRDEGKTIAVGKVLKYKPHGSTGVATTESS